MTDYVYTGRREGRDAQVKVASGAAEWVLDAARSLRFRRHSRRLDWGYLGASPAQLALVILLMETSPDEALRRHTQFKKAVIAQLPFDGWELRSSVVQGWLDTDRQERPLREGEPCSF